MHPWVEASDWIYTHIPAEATVIVEQWDDSLPLDMPAVDSRFLANSQFIIHALNWFPESEIESNLRQNAVEISRADFIIIASGRNYSPVLKQCLRFPLSGAYYRSLFSGELGFSLVQTFERYPQLFGWVVMDDPSGWTGMPLPRQVGDGLLLTWGYADESFTVYDHPRAYIFQNILRNNSATLLEIIEDELYCTQENG